MPAVIIFPPINACLNAVTKYENGIHCIIFNIVGCSVNLVTLQTTGVAQKNSCINIPNKLEKSGTSVVSADVNLVNAIINAYNANITYIIINKLGIYPNNVHITVATNSKNIDTNALPISDIIGITSTGNTTFFTK